ncbi:hypothetical protein HanIR_Chr02g0064221 [Helianthus annuus]|nr:hypothetical protein HanIR_Chr02g0064221 [Helianthus annuus]
MVHPNHMTKIETIFKITPRYFNKYTHGSYIFFSDTTTPLLQIYIYFSVTLLLIKLSSV